jgi:hypothetical protein
MIERPSSTMQMERQPNQHAATVAAVTHWYESDACTDQESDKFSMPQGIVDLNAFGQ